MIRSGDARKVGTRDLATLKSRTSHLGKARKYRVLRSVASLARALSYYETHVVCAGLDLRVEPVLVLVPEGRVAHQQDVEDDPARPDVHRLPVGLLLQHLRGEVARGAGEA